MREIRNLMQNMGLQRMPNIDPNYACAKCVSKAVDENGEAISFFNVTEDGHGCQGKLMASNNLTRLKTCFIKGSKFKADEAYLGGIVLLPEIKRKRSGIKTEII